MLFALRKFSVKYRIPIGIVLITLGIYLGFQVSWWLGWLPILIGLLTIVAHFMVGPISLLQKYIEEGDVDGAKKLINSVKKPNLLYKPFRSAYYMIKSNFSTMGDDLDTAEEELRKGLESGSSDQQFQGTAYLQLGSISYRKGKMKDAYENLRKAIKIGLPDADSNATAYLQLSSICMQRRDYRGAKFYYNKAKNEKAKNEQIIEQINEMKKYISRMPG